MFTLRSLTFKKHENRQSRDPPVVNGKRQKVTFTENATVLFYPICWYTVCLRSCFHKLEIYAKSTEIIRKSYYMCSYEYRIRFSLSK